MKRHIYFALKRIFDIFSSSMAILFTSPLWVLNVMMIRLSSPGPVFYNASRVCKNNEPFDMYKFRSMHVFVPQKEGQISEGTFVGNKRIFKYGNFMRKSKLDELPQLLNVFLGQMSVIGPRPVAKTRAERTYVGKYSDIPSVKPGLACLDSLFDYAHGELVISDNAEYQEKIIPVRMELAKMYVEKQSISLDFYCIFRTLSLIFQIVVLKKRDFPYTRYEIEARRNVFGKDA